MLQYVQKALLLLLCYLCMATTLNAQSTEIDGYLKIIEGTSRPCRGATITYKCEWVPGTNPNTQLTGTPSWTVSGGYCVGGSTGYEVDIRWYSYLVNGSISIRQPTVTPPSVKPSVYGSLNVKAKCILDKEQSEIQSKNIIINKNPVSISECGTYELRCTEVLNTQGYTDVKYTWFYSLDNGAYKPMGETINDNTYDASLSSYSLSSAAKIRFMVEITCGCDNLVKRTQYSQAYLPLRYCFKNLDTDLEEPTCYGYRDAKLFITGIPDPSTYDNYAGGNHDDFEFTITKYDLPQYDPEEEKFICNKTPVAGPGSDPVTVNGEKLCPTGYACNPPNYVYDGGTYILDESNITLQCSNSAYDDITGIGAGKYLIKIENAGLFTPTTLVSTEITQPEELKITNVAGAKRYGNTDYDNNKFDVSAPGKDDGRINLDITGGSGTYRHTISGSMLPVSPAGSPGSYYIEGYSAGEHVVVEITDNKGCHTDPATQTVTLTPPAQLGITVNEAEINDVSCNSADNGGHSDGAIPFTIIGGIKPYTISYPSGAVKSVTTTDGAGIFEGLGAGTYNLTAQGQGGQTATSNGHNIGEPDSIYYEVSGPVAPSCPGGRDGQVTITTNGPHAPYIQSFNGTPISGAFLGYYAQKTIKGLPSRNDYTAIVRDTNKCYKNILNIQIPARAPVSLATVTPVIVECAGGVTGEIKVTSSNGHNNSYYHYLSGDGAYNPLSVIDSLQGQSVSFDSLRAGDYYLFVQDGYRCLDSGYIHNDYRDTVALGENGLITIDTTITPVTEKGGSSGKITGSLQHGAGKYQYALVFNGDTSKAITTNGEIQADTLRAGTYQLLVRDTCWCSNNIEGGWWKPAPIRVKEPQYALGIATTGLTHILCYGNTTGGIEVEASGGWGGYTYNLYTNTGAEIETGNSTGTFEGLAAGIYEIEVIDSLGATTSINDTLTEPETPLRLSGASVDSVKCYGASTGSVELALSGGTGSYYWSLDSLAWPEGASIGGLGVGTGSLSKNYTIYYRDANWCGGDTTITLYQYPEITIDSITQRAAQTTVHNGVLKGYASGGHSPYSYIWAGMGVKDTVQEYNGLQAGTYSLTVTDANTCGQYQHNITLENRRGPELTGVTYQKPTCHGWGDGYISFSPVYGNPPYGIDLTKGGSIDSSYLGLDSAQHYSFQHLYAGDYLLEITDSWGWENLPVYQYPLEDTPPLSLDGPLVGHITQHGGSDGKITFKISGGNGYYEYFLYDSLRHDTVQHQTTSGLDSVTNLLPGYYTFSYRDTCGCTNDAGSWATLGSIQIIEPEPLLFIVDTIEQPDCHGYDNGQITVHGTGGWGYPYYHYRVDSGAWSPDSTFTGLIAGSYYIEIKDSKNITYGDSVKITQPGVFELASPVGISDVSCNGGSNGSISLEMQGGTLPYIITVVETDTIYTTDTLISGLTQGIYPITLRDTRGCSIGVLTGHISQPTELIDTVYATEAQDSLSNGSLHLGVWGSVPPYDITWLNGIGDTLSESLNNAGNDSLMGLPTGEYTISVTDMHGCNNTHPAFVPQKGGPKTRIMEPTDISCNSYGNGSMSFDLFEGHPPYDAWLTYQNSDTVARFANAPDSVNYTVNSLLPGDYTLSVRDSWGWVAKEYYRLDQPDTIRLTYSITDIAIYGQHTGSVQIGISGGHGVYNYLFKHTLTGGTLQEGTTSGVILVTGLPAGLYSLYYKDTSGCTNGQPGWAIEDGITVSEPMPLGLGLIRETGPSCHGGNTGSIHVEGFGGKANGSYQYRIDGKNWQPSGLFRELPAGAHTIEIKDGAGALYSGVYTLTEPGALTLESIHLTENTCGGSKPPEAELAVSGGTGPYQHSLDGIFWVDGTTVGLNYGENSIYLKDVHGCEAGPETTTIQQTEPLDANFAIQDCQYGETNGHIKSTVAGGTPPYTIEWRNTEGALLGTGALLNNIGTGTYRFTVTGHDGCSISREILLGAKYGPRLSAGVTSTPVSCIGKSDGQISFCVQDGNGNYNIRVLKGGSLIKTFQNIMPGDTCGIHGLESGVYHLELKDSLMWAGTGSFNIPSPEALQLSLSSSTLPTCYGYSDGTLSVSATGGNGGYTYHWGTGATGPIATGLQAGTYSVSVTDSKGCIQQGGYTLPNPEKRTVDLGGDKAICEGQEYLLTAGGYASYSWSYNGETFSHSPEVWVNEQGEYSLLAQSPEGCQASDTMYLEVSTDLLEAEFLMPSEAYESDTVVLIDISWPEPETTRWVFGEHVTRIHSEPYMEQISFQGPGVYTIKLVSEMGMCTDSTSKQITIKQLPPENGEGIKLGSGEPFIQHFNIYPNPNTGYFTVEVELAGEADMGLRVFNMQQNRYELIQEYHNSSKYLLQFGLGQLRSGIYLVTINAGGEKQAKRVLITR